MKRLIFSLALVLASSGVANATFTVDLPGVPGGKPRQVEAGPVSVDIEVVAGSGPMQNADFGLDFVATPAGTNPVVGSVLAPTGGVLPIANYSAEFGIPFVTQSFSSLNGTSGDVVLSLNATSPVNVSPGSILGTINLDLTGALPGDMFEIFIIENSADAFTNWSPDGGINEFAFTAVGGGKLQVVPEPSAFALIGLVGCIGYAGRWARNRWFATSEE